MKPWRWDPIHQQAFDNVKAAIAKETVLAYVLPMKITYMNTENEY
jgi:hypothetical protein